MDKDRQNLLMMVTHNSGDGFMRLTEQDDGKFILLTQNREMCSAYDFPPDTPDYVKEALRNLQYAMERSNLEGNGGGANYSTPRP